MKAFPTPAISVNDEARITSIGGEGGMDLRDYFAAMAMQKLKLENTDRFAMCAGLAYEMADAMMKARKA